MKPQVNKWFHGETTFGAAVQQEWSTNIEAPREQKKMKKDKMKKKKRYKVWFKVYFNPTM